NERGQQRRDRRRRDLSILLLRRPGANRGEQQQHGPALLQEPRPRRLRQRVRRWRAGVEQACCAGADVLEMGHRKGRPGYTANRRFLRICRRRRRAVQSQAGPARRSAGPRRRPVQTEQQKSDRADDGGGAAWMRRWMFCGQWVSCLEDGLSPPLPTEVLTAHGARAALPGRFGRAGLRPHPPLHEWRGRPAVLWVTGAAIAVSLFAFLPLAFIVWAAFQAGWSTAFGLIVRPRVGEL